MKEYLEGIQKRFQEDSDMSGRLAGLKAVLTAGDFHLGRFDHAHGRFVSARTRSDKVAEKYENEVMSALLYEAMDHIFMVISELDLDAFGLKAPIVGQGLHGEHAGEVLSLFDRLETLARGILSREQESDLRLDFSESCEEKKGVTYTVQGHWQHLSFEHYFAQAKKLVQRRLESKPRFWQSQTVRAFVRRKGYASLTNILDRIDEADSLSEKKSMATAA